MTGLLSFGQSNSKEIKYPYAQIKNDNLEFVFSSPQEKQLREIALVKENAYRYIEQLKTQIYIRDTIISELTQINSMYVNREFENLKQEKLLRDKYRELNEKTVELQDTNNKLLIENKNLVVDKNNWKSRFVSLASVVGVGLAFLILN